MSSSATRGALLAVVAVVLGFLILRGAEATTQVPVATGATFEPTPTAVIEAEPDDAVVITTPTVVVDTSLARNNNQVSVLVVNGTDVTGQAGRLSSALRNQGFITREPKNGIAQAASVIYYRPSFAAEATVVRNLLNGTTPIAPMPDTDPFLGDGVDLGPVEVLVLVGDDDLSKS